MAQFLYKVDEVIQLGRNCIIANPGIPSHIQGIRPGRALELRRPDGSMVETYISAIPYITPHDPKRPIHFTFPPGLMKQDVPVGTEVWLRDDTLA